VCSLRAVKYVDNSCSAKNAIRLVCIYSAFDCSIYFYRQMVPDAKLPRRACIWLRYLPTDASTLLDWTIIGKSGLNVSFNGLHFSRRRTPVEASLALKGRHISFANHVKYLGVIFDKKLTWKLRTETTATKALRIFLSIYPILKS
jgi:hypothetical protein